MLLSQQNSSKPKTVRGKPVTFDFSDSNYNNRWTIKMNHRRPPIPHHVHPQIGGVEKPQLGISAEQFEIDGKCHDKTVRNLWD